MPAAALALVADLFAREPGPGAATDRGLTADDHLGASAMGNATNVPSTNNPGHGTNIDWTLPMSGMRG